MTQDQLFDRPDQFLLGFEDPNAVFVEMNREAYHRSIFCDMRISPVSKQLSRLQWRQLADVRDRDFTAAPDISYIFHVAHCGSTLLARALDIKEENIVYREPLALRQLAAEAVSMRALGDDWHRRLRLATTMLGRSYNPKGPVIVKANVPVNFIIDDLLAVSPGRPSLLLYFCLEHYLLAILRTPNHRKWVQSVSSELDGAINAYAPRQSNMSDAEMAARLWLAQITAYNNVLAKHPTVASLDAEILFNNPRLAVAKSFEHFEQSCSDSRLDEILGGEIFARYSKNPGVAFDNDSRLERRDQLKQELVPEIAEAREWISAQTAARPLPSSLMNSLTGDSPELLQQV